MAKYERSFKGNYRDFVGELHNHISSGSVSVTYEDGSDITMGDVNIAMRVYERYSMTGGNRVSLNTTIVSQGDNITVTAISAGGSQALFFKFNTFGEKAFLNIAIDGIEKYISKSYKG